MLIKGVVLGFTAAAQPGPFQAYLLSQVSRHGWRRTLPAALAPLISDGPIIALMLFVLRGVPEQALGWIQIAGGAFILTLGSSAFRALRRSRREPELAAEPHETDRTSQPNRGIWHASLMNLLNPNPYIFWGTVGVPIVLDGWRTNPTHAYAFMFGMYSFLIGGLAMFIIIFGKLGALSRKANAWLNGISAIALTGFGAWQLWSGIIKIQ